MNEYRHNEKLLRDAALALGPLLDQVVFVGGATTILHLTNRLVDVRATIDVDVIIDASLKNYQKAESTLRKLGFQPDPALVCRHHKDGIIIDFIPTDPKILGFSSRWYAQGHRLAEPRVIDDIQIRVLSFPYFVATKLEAFRGRGKNIYYGSWDIEDLVIVFAGRPAFLSELNNVKGEIGSYIRAEFRHHLGHPEFHSTVRGNVPRDAKYGAIRIIADLKELSIEDGKD